MMNNLYWISGMSLVLNNDNACICIIFQATQFDNADRYALATLTVARPGSSTRDLTFLQSHYYAGVLENTPIGSVILTVVTNKPRNKVI